MNQRRPLQNVYGDRIHQVYIGNLGHVASGPDGARPGSPTGHNLSVKELHKPRLVMNRGKQLKHGPSSTTSRRVEKVNVFRDPSRMCGLACMVERENEYDNASELDLSASSTPLKLKPRPEPPVARHTARPFGPRANSVGSMDNNTSMNARRYLGNSPEHPMLLEQAAPSCSPHRPGPTPDQMGPVGGDSMVTVINLR